LPWQGLQRLLRERWKRFEAIRDAPERTAMDALQIKEGKILIGMNRLNIEVDERRARIASRRKLPAGR